MYRTRNFVSSPFVKESLVLDKIVIQSYNTGQFYCNSSLKGYEMKLDPSITGKTRALAKRCSVSFKLNSENSKMSNAEIAAALGIDHNADGAFVNPQLFYAIVGNSGEVDILGVKTGDDTFKLRPYALMCQESAKQFATIISMK